MPGSHNEAFSRILIETALEFSDWDFRDPHQVRFELNSSTGRVNSSTGRADYVLGGQRGPLGVLEAIVGDTVDSIAARFNLRYNEQKWVDATAQILAEDSRALHQFMRGEVTMFTAAQFNQLGGVTALAHFEEREQVFEALRQSTLVRQSRLAAAA